MYNCKRIDFDNLLFSFVKKDKTFMRARVKKILQEDHLIVVEKNKREELLTFKKLIVATGSGKSIFPELRKEDQSVLYASRAYVKSDFVFNKNMASFSDDIKPGYFWIFPVGDNLYNTGVLLHSAQKYNSIYDIHKMKLTEFFNSFEMVSHTRWPLRIYSHKPFFMMEDITCIGDANHSIDPLLGHGIDTGMLEAREQVIALVTTNRFAQTSAILKLVDKKNKLSFDYKKRIFSQSTAEKRLDFFLEFLVFLNKYYAEINTSLESSKISLTQKLKVKRQYNEHSNSIRRILNMFKKQ